MDIRMLVFHQERKRQNTYGNKKKIDNTGTLLKFLLLYRH